MSTVAAHQDEVLLCVQRLVQLAEQKNKVLCQRQHAQLQAIVEAEEEALATLEQLQNSAASSARSGSDADTLAAAIAELQRLNSVNAAILQEYLAGVTKCLEYLASSATPTYSPEGKGRTDTGVQHLLDVTG